MFWQTVKLGEVVDINCKSYSERMGWDYVNYLDTGNITNNRIESIQRIDLRFEKLPSRAKRMVKTNSIIYSTVRPNQRHFGIVKQIPDNFLVSTGFAVLDCDTQCVDPDFVYYFLTKPDIIEALQAIGEQSVSTFPSIKPYDLTQIEILLPPLDVQKRIASVLVGLDNKISINNGINHNLAA